jgi:acyl-CoA thioester hydrolase
MKKGLSDAFKVYHTAQVRVLYADTDKMGIVYNGNYLKYFEIGRTELLRALQLPYADLEQYGAQLPVIEAFVSYKSPAYYDDVLSIDTVCSFERGLLLRIHYSIKKDKSIISEGYTLHTFIDAVTKKPIRPPALFIDTILTNSIDSMGNELMEIYL